MRRMPEENRMLRIALCQLMPTGSGEGNLRKGRDACRSAKAMGADIALFPEMWSCGYAEMKNAGDYRANAIPADGEFVTAFGKLAAELEMAVGVTYLEAYSPQPRNSFRLYDRFGRDVLDYAKVHICDFDAERFLTAGDCFPVCELDTGIGTVSVGAMICYDREFPESARLLAMNGAELILTPNACPMEQNRLCQLRGRAFENLTAIATVNYPLGKPDCNGRSTLFDGVPWQNGVPWGSRDMCILEAPETEGVYLAELNLGLLRETRKVEPYGPMYRRVGRYELLPEAERKTPHIWD